MNIPVICIIFLLTLANKNNRYQYIKQMAGLYQNRKNASQNTIPSLSGTFGIPARLALNPKIPKEPSSPSRSDALTANPNKTKIGDKLIRKWLISKYLVSHVLFDF